MLQRYLCGCTYEPVAPVNGRPTMQQFHDGAVGIPEGIIDRQDAICILCQKRIEKWRI